MKNLLVILLKFWGTLLSVVVAAALFLFVGSIIHPYFVPTTLAILIVVSFSYLAITRRVF